jgi:protein TonB
MNLRISILMLFVCLASLCYGQTMDTVYYDADWKTTIKANASFYRIGKLVEESKKYEVTDFYMSGKIQMTGTFSSMSPEIKDGVFTWYKDDKKINEIIYEQGKARSRTNFLDDGSPDTTVRVFGSNPGEERPEYPGGINKLYKYIGKSFLYPKSLLKPRLVGKIILSFVVEKDGSIGDVYVKQSFHPVLDAEAIRVVENMKNWKPGRKDGEPVRVVYELPLGMK